MNRSLWIAKTGMEGQQMQAGHHLQQPGQRRHQRLQARRRGVRGPDVPEPAPGRRGQQRADAAAHRPAGRPGRARGGHRRATSARATCSRPATTWTWPSRARASSRSRCPTAPPATPATARSSSTRSGQIVTANGHVLQPGITVPANAQSVTIAADGTVNVTLPAQAAPQSVGQLQLASFINPAGLDPRGQNLYAETAASGAPNAGAPGADGLRRAACRALSKPATSTWSRSWWR